jgi:hypothetical protein
MKPNQFLKGFKHGNAGLFKFDNNKNDNITEERKYNLNTISIKFEDKELLNDKLQV